MKQALILDNIDRGPTYTFFQANDFYITKKVLKSSISNWESICVILENDHKDEIVIVGKFTEHILGYFLDKEYSDVSKRLIQNILKKRHIIFVYSDNYHGYFNFNDGYVSPDEAKNQKTEFDPKLKDLIDKFNRLDLNIAIYETLVDLEISSQNFIDNVSQGLLLRFYIPNDKFGSTELDKFIILFKDFISTVTNKIINITQNRTKHGITCTLYSETAEIKHEDLYKMFDDFTKFMELCLNNPEAAAEILINNDIPRERVSYLITKHIKEAKRIFLDLKQDKERRLLSIKQNLESELLEEHLGNELNKKIESLVPNITGIVDLIIDRKIDNLQININPQIISKVEGVVAKEFNGSVVFTKEDNQLKEMIQEYSVSKAQFAELISALYEMKDSEISSKDKKAATSKLKNFVLKIGEKIGDVAFDLLTKYLEKKMGLD
ncbi:hypothetical protein [Haliscomenobacter sp.]|uniref:hypothetical protein n=1 Tax=Haliscomenobacter sp. TaxID=2717303 RepID=UPI003BAC1A42